MELTEIKVTMDDDIASDTDLNNNLYYQSRGKDIGDKGIELLRQLSDKICVDFRGNTIDIKRMIHSDGTVGLNNGLKITSSKKVETIINEIREQYRELECQIELVIAIANDKNGKFREYADDYVLSMRNNYPAALDYYYNSFMKDFLNSIMLGVYLHDNTVEVLNRDRAVTSYSGYRGKYEKNRSIYFKHYYE